jgi:hypothetical protein
MLAMRGGKHGKLVVTTTGKSAAANSNACTRSRWATASSHREHQNFAALCFVHSWMAA